MAVQRTNIIAEVSNILEKRIKAGKYKAGDCLPSQSKLANELRVSRNSIREAINRLTFIGLVKPVQGVGTLVLANRSDLVLRQALKQFDISPKDASTIMETRVVVERAIVRLAAVRARKSDIVNLENNLAEQRELLKNKDREKFAESDVDFHLLLGKASRNKLLLEIVESYITPFQKLIHAIMRTPITMEMSFLRHSEIVEGIRNKDPIAADRHMSAHLRNTLENLNDSPAVNEAKEALFF